MIEIPALTLVLTAAVVGAFNPSAIGTAVLFLSKLLGSGKSSRHVALLGLSYAAALFLTYFAGGLLVLGVLALIPTGFIQYVAIAIALGVVFLAIFEIKDYFWYGRGFSLRVPEALAHKIRHWPPHHITILDAAAIGAIAGVGELACTSAPYVAVITLLRATLSLQSVGMIAAYAAVFIAPVVVILVLVAAGVRISHIQRGKEENKPILRLCIGLLLVALAWVTLLIANGAIGLV